MRGRCRRPARLRPGRSPPAAASSHAPSSRDSRRPQHRLAGRRSRAAASPRRAADAAPPRLPPAAAAGSLGDAAAGASPIPASAAARRSRPRSASTRSCSASATAASASVALARTSPSSQLRVNLLVGLDGSPRALPRRHPRPLRAPSSARPSSSRPPTELGLKEEVDQEGPRPGAPEARGAAGAADPQDARAEAARPSHDRAGRAPRRSSCCGIPQLLDRILADFERCGVVGEDTNKLVGYLAAVSRKLDEPLAVIVQSARRGRQVVADGGRPRLRPGGGAGRSTRR